MTFKDVLERETNPFYGLTGTDLIKAKCRAKVKAKFDKIDADRVQAIKQEKKQEEVKAFLKAHAAKKRQQMIEERMRGK